MMLPFNCLIDYFLNLINRRKGCDIFHNFFLKLLIIFLFDYSITFDFVLDNLFNFISVHYRAVCGITVNHRSVWLALQCCFDNIIDLLFGHKSFFNIMSQFAHRLLFILQLFHQMPCLRLYNVYPLFQTVLELVTLIFLLTLNLS